MTRDDNAAPVAVITGAAGNLGQAVAQKLAADGMRLALLDRNMQRLQSLTEQLGPGVRAYAVDLLSQDSVNQAIAQAIQDFARIDALANIAGGFSMGPPLHETDDRDWNLMFDLNSRSLLHLCRAVIPHLLAQGSGSIVSVSARAAREGKAGMGPYCASKAAVITLTETLAAEHKQAGITANCILPGTIDTPQNREAMPDADHSRWVPPAALADVVGFLLSPAARCVTGAAIPVYGQS